MAAEIVIVGAGAAGLLAAGFAAQRGLKVTVLEKTDRTAKKVRISGKGRCNVTNAMPIKDFPQFYPGNGRFLYGALYRFSNEDVMSLFRSLGVELKVERGQRVFPASDDAHEIANALERFARQSGARIRFGTRVQELIIRDGSVAGVVSSGPQGRIVNEAAAVVIASGGKSYPGTGSTGDGYHLAAQAGHTIVEPRPSLVPLKVVEEWPKELAGLTLKNVRLTFSYGDESISEFGDMMFAHFGLTGPIVLTASDMVAQWVAQGANRVECSLDLKPALTHEQLDRRLVRDFEVFSRKQFKNALDELLPKRMIPIMIKLSGIAPDKPVNQISREERLQFRDLLKQVPLTVSGTLPLAAAIVTAGGVAVDEVDPRTMESRLVKGLYFAGEVLDVHGVTGGFNLQAAFSTAYAAAQALTVEG
ncbi:MAG: NAD(P)/FAD-dependent oxidoreductase [Firmicutes bacterium]|nr:NAD(P)/FAD-dependent oxidoreductase [Bacillota bacterium]